MAKGKRLRVTLGTCQGCGLLWTLRREKGKAPVIAPHDQPPDSHLVGDVCPGGGEPPMERACLMANAAFNDLAIYAEDQDRLAEAHLRGESVQHYRIEYRKGERIRIEVSASELDADLRAAQVKAASLHAQTAAEDARRHARRLLEREAKVRGKRLATRCLPNPDDKVKMDLPDTILDEGCIGVVQGVEQVSESEWKVAVCWSNGRKSAVSFPRHLLTLVSR